MRVFALAKIIFYGAMCAVPVVICILGCLFYGLLGLIPLAMLIWGLAGIARESARG